MFPLLILFAGSLLGAEIKRIDPPASTESGMPYLAASPDGQVFLSWTDMLGGKNHAFRFSRWTRAGWRAPETIATGDNWFVNWADFPAMTILPDGTMLAHWLSRGSATAKFGYGIRVAKRAPGQAKWKEIHGMSLEEKSDYAGFLSFVPGEAKAVFLSPPIGDSAHHGATAGHDDHGGHRKTLRFLSFQNDGSVESDLEVDADTCSCCPTAIGRTKLGLIAAYRDHQAGEIRDISVIRQVKGHWSEPASLHEDGWKINGCPTDGPSLVTYGNSVAIAWLTRANGIPKVMIAVSSNNGKTFTKPIQIDSGNPLGRPAIVAYPQGGWAAIWLEKTGGEQNEIRLRRLSSDASLSGPIAIAKVPAGRLAGFPKLAASGQDLIVAWRDQQVRAALITFAQEERKNTKAE
ncbi:MAG TPA: hypothetical protein VFQ91_11425, partial [Bryobacteraceae bacterium]|nr:hypothetical protein [Bryobacteraceae bacterium]